MRTINKTAFGPELLPPVILLALALIGVGTGLLQANDVWTEFHPTARHSLVDPLQTPAPQNPEPGNNPNPDPRQGDPTPPTPPQQPSPKNSPTPPNTPTPQNPTP